MQLTIPVPENAIHLPPGMLRLSDEEFFQFCQANRDLRIERSPNGEIIVMSPAGGYASFQNLKVASQLDAWATKDGSGVAFESSAGFRLPNGAMRSPDAAWVTLARLKTLGHRDKEQFIPLCPDFVIEVASPSDDIAELREKMKEYLAGGLRLGWLYGRLEIMRRSNGGHFHSEETVKLNLASLSNDLYSVKRRKFLSCAEQAYCSQPGDWEGICIVLRLAY